MLVAAITLEDLLAWAPRPAARNWYTVRGAASLKHLCAYLAPTASTDATVYR